MTIITHMSGSLPDEYEQSFRQSTRTN